MGECGCRVERIIYTQQFYDGPPRPIYKIFYCSHHASAERYRQERDAAYQARDNFMAGVESMRTERTKIQRARDKYWLALESANKLIAEGADEAQAQHASAERYRVALREISQCTHEEWCDSKYRGGNHLRCDCHVNIALIALTPPEGSHE